MSSIQKLAYQWIKTDPGKVDIKSDYYCQTRDVFQTRLDKMTSVFLKNQKKEQDIYLISAIVGEIGNNSFDHNLGNWPDIMGVYFAYEIVNNRVEIILVDRGQGILKTLKKVRPELKNDLEALRVAFTERISGREPEKRGNGLKFVRESVKNIKANLIFVSGNASAELNNKMEIKQIDNKIKGCLAILTCELN